MEVARPGRGGRSSSVELSSPPSEPSEHPPSYSTPPHNAFQYAGDAPNSTIRVGVYRDFDDSASRLTSATAQPAPTSGGTSHTSVPGIPQHQPPPAKEKKPRKKREANAEKKEQAPRKPRNVAGTAASRRKIKADSTNRSPLPDMTVSSAPRQAKISDLLTPHEPPAPPGRFGEAPMPPQNTRSGFTMQSDAMHNSTLVYPQLQPPQQSYPSPQRPSGLNYDPVRSMTISTPSTPNLQSRHATDATPPRPVFRPGASPVISSVTEPPPAPSNAQEASPRFLPPTPNPPPPSFPQFATAAAAAAPSSAHATASAEPVADAVPNSVVPPTHPPEASAMEVDNVIVAPALKPPATGKKDSSGTPSIADQSPGLRAKAAPPAASAPPPAPPPPAAAPAAAPPPPAPVPPLPQGSGLLSSAMFGGDSAKNATMASTNEAPNIILHVDLKGKSNVVVNFARMAEEKYGFEALYPRLAKNRARLAKVAEAGDALEKAANGGKLGGTSAEESGDEDMSVDIDRESDNDGDIAMSGINGGTGTGANSETDGKGTKKRRRRKVEEYDQDDDFVDDSELAWEQQAAASKDGFFVYCGPLVPEGEKPAVDQAGGESKRGRGGGRGRGRGRGASTAAGGTGEPGGRGVGATTRGGGAARKPRVTKAGRAVLDREKQEREKMAPLAAKPSGYPA